MTATSINTSGALVDALEEKGPFGWGHIYRGTILQLVAAGIAKQEWFPGQGDNFKYCQRVVVFHNGARPRLIRTRGRYEPDEGEVLFSLYRRGKGGRFEVWKRLPPSEQRARHEELQPARLAETLKRVKEEREKEPRTPQPWNPAEFRAEVLMLLRINETIAMRPATGECCFASRDIPAHRLCAEDLERLRQKLAEAKMIVENSKVEPINHAAKPRPALSLVKG